MMNLQKHFLLRRNIDPWLLAAAAMMLPLRLWPASLIIFIYGCIGTYLFFFRHRFTHNRPYAQKRQLLGREVFFLITAYFLWNMMLIAWRGELSWQNRQIAYAGLLWVLAFAGCGMVLIRDPLRFFVIGSRLGVIAAAAMTLWFEYRTGGRIGAGGNAAVFAYIAAMAAIAATIPLKTTPRFLPNGVYYLAIGTCIVFASQTRAIMVLLPLFLLIEIILGIRRWTNIKLQVSCLALLFIVVAGLNTTGPVASVLSDRFSGMLHYYETGDSSQWHDKISADTRIQMWFGAVQVIAQNPLTGVGSQQKMVAVTAVLADQATLLDGYIHVHNMFLDELLINGFIGLILLLAAAVSFYAVLWRYTPCWAARRVLVYSLIIVTGYGMLHNPMLHEMTITATMFFFAVMYAAASKTAFVSKIGSVNDTNCASSADKVICVVSNRQ